MKRTPPPRLTLSKHALFLDIDGTLADITPTPSQAFVESATISELNTLAGQLGGALAIVSGRQLQDIDGLIGLPRLCAAGTHGAQLRTPRGTTVLSSAPSELFRQVGKTLLARTLGLDGIVIEQKLLAVAVHYRANPSLEDRIRKVAAEVAGQYKDLTVIEGKFIAEILPRAVDKGIAITELMKSPPFAGRVPVFAGDDVTDEDGFKVVNDMEGISIKIGSGPSRATYGLDTSVSLRRWLSRQSVT